jgi:hypothetical protein
MLKRFSNQRLLLVQTMRPTAGAPKTAMTAPKAIQVTAANVIVPEIETVGDEIAVVTEDAIGITTRMKT